MTRGEALAQHLVASLPASRAGLFNPWRTACRHDAAPDAARSRLDRLGRHLDCDAKWILIGEAVGYQGARYSGIAFTSERLVLEGAIPRVQVRGRLTRRDLPFSEPSATVVWRELKQCRMATHTVLWNALSLHPHPPATPWSNRTPARHEFELGLPALELLLAAFPDAGLLAVGRHAQAVLARITQRPVHGLRHPAYGGATEFAEGLRVAMQRARSRTPVPPLRSR